MTGIRAFSKRDDQRIVEMGGPWGAPGTLAVRQHRPFPDYQRAAENRVEILAALTAGLRIESAVYLPAFAFNMANAVIVGNLLGEKKRKKPTASGLVTALIGVYGGYSPGRRSHPQRPMDRLGPLKESGCGEGKCPVSLHRHDQRAFYGMGRDSRRWIQRGR